MKVQHFHFISIVSCESIMPIGHVISQKMAIEITICVRYKKFLPAASILMNVAWCCGDLWLIRWVEFSATCVESLVRPFTVTSWGINCDLMYPLIMSLESNKWFQLWHNTVNWVFGRPVAKQFPYLTRFKTNFSLDLALQTSTCENREVAMPNLNQQTPPPPPPKKNTVFFQLFHFWNKIDSQIK
jgi:hypothetical protein